MYRTESRDGNWAGFEVCVPTITQHLADDCHGFNDTRIEATFSTSSLHNSILFCMPSTLFHPCPCLFCPSLNPCSYLKHYLIAQQVFESAPRAADSGQGTLPCRTTCGSACGTLRWLWLQLSTGSTSNQSSPDACNSQKQTRDNAITRAAMTSAGSCMYCLPALKTS